VLRRDFTKEVGALVNCKQQRPGKWGFVVREKGRRLDITVAWDETR